jgi:hypothetical protein
LQKNIFMNTIEIKKDYEILHFDEYPILFIGKNDNSEIVIGSLLFEEDDTNTVKYFHCIVEIDLALEFLNRKLPYIEILKKASLFIVTKDYNDKILQIDATSFHQLDESMLPLPSAYCPIIENKIIRRFGTSRKEIKGRSSGSSFSVSKNQLSHPRANTRTPIVAI